MCDIEMDTLYWPETLKPWTKEKVATLMICATTITKKNDGEMMIVYLVLVIFACSGLADVRIHWWSWLTSCVLHKGGTTEDEPAAEIDAKAIKMSVGCIRQKTFIPSFNRISKSMFIVVRAYGQSIQVTSHTKATPKSIGKLKYLCQLYIVFRKVFLH